MESRSCVVVGAGISGLMCAKVLREKGFSVTVLEGRSRIGGRIHTDEHFCDLGASWIHGEVGNPLMKFEVESMASPSGGHSVACFDARGKRYSAEEYQKQEDAFDTLLNVTVSKKREKLKEDESLLESCLRFGDLTPITWGQMLGMHSLMGADLRKISSFYWDDETDNEGVDRYFPKGYKQIIDLIAEGTDIVLNAVVVKVEETSDRILISTSDGRVFLADFCCVTVPLGVLKRDFINFVPSLPKKVLRAIDRIGFGTLNKVLLRFDDVFWDKEAVWLSFDPLNAKDFVFVDVLNLFRCNQLPILVGFSGGSFAESFAQRSDDDIGQELMKTIRRGYPNAPDFVSVKVTRWNADPFAWGSYSHFKLGGKGRKDCKTLSRPVSRRLVLAGEHTSTSHPAYVHGAMQSGQRAAKQIAKASKKK